MISQKNNKGIAVKSQVVAPRTLKSEAMNSSRENELLPSLSDSSKGEWDYTEKLTSRLSVIPTISVGPRRSLKFIPRVLSLFGE